LLLKKSLTDSPPISYSKLTVNDEPVIGTTKAGLPGKPAGLTSVAVPGVNCKTNSGVPVPVPPSPDVNVQRVELVQMAIPVA